jgi:hypothetical protein
MLNDLDPYKHRFLSTFMTLVDLGSFIDSRALVDHISRIPVVKFLHGEEYGSIHAGALFIQ